LLYFAYGSNMSSYRLKARIPSARPLGCGCLSRHKLLFHKVSIHDGSGKGDASYTGNSSDSVFGVLYDLSATDLDTLDAIEGVGQGYEARTVQIIAATDQLVTAHTYLATITDPGLKPLDWYKEHVLRGAIEHDLPSQYIEYIERIEALVDVNSERAARQRSLYG